MRILHISSAEFLGGGERHLADLANSLAARGHDVRAAVRPHSPLINELSLLSKEKISTLQLRNSLDAPSARQLASLVKKHQIQIVHAHMARDYPLAAYAAARTSHAKLIITRHVLFPLNRLHRLTLSQVARVIAVSDAVAVQLRTEQTVPADRITVVPNGIDVDRFETAAASFDRAEFLRNWNLPQESLLVGTVGELKPLKGQEEFLRAAAQVAAVVANAHFVVAGTDSSRDQENRARLEQLTDELGLRSRVLFIPWIENIAMFYAALDVFVSSSRTESFGLAIVEAMASGTAVVATSTEGAKTIVEPESTGLLVPVGGVEEIARAIISLLTDKVTQARLADAAREAARARFSLARMVEATEKIYEDSLKVL